MKHIVNILKNEIFNQTKQSEELVKKVTVSQESYLKDRSNEAFYKIWSDDVQELQKKENNLRYLRNAYVTMCEACGIEPLTNIEIVAEKSDKKAKKASLKKSTKVESAESEK